MRDVNKKYKGKYTYVKYSDINYYPFRFGYPISPKSIPVRIFYYFGSDFSGRVRIRIQVSDKMLTPNLLY